jgi:hypothetical protein
VCDLVDTVKVFLERLTEFPVGSLTWQEHVPPA